MAGRKPTPAVEAVEQLIFESPLVRIGLLRCPPAHSSFNNPFPTQNYALVFPRSSLEIHRADGERFASDPSMANFWNPGQEYRRRSISPDGAVSDWFGFAPALVRDICGSLDESAERRPGREFRFTRIRQTPSILLASRQLVRALAQAKIDVLEAEERAIAILREAVRESYGQWSTGTRDSVPLDPASRDEVIWRSERYLAEHFAEPVTVADVARAAGISPFHLCRTFKRALRSTIHARRNAIRLAAALQHVLDTKNDLTEIALELGFNSHSHFTSVFRCHFGVTPSAARLQRQAPAAQAFDSGR